MKTAIDKIWFKHSTLAIENKCYMGYEEFQKAIQEYDSQTQDHPKGGKLNRNELHEAFVTAMKIDKDKDIYEHLQLAFEWFYSQASILYSKGGEVKTDVKHPFENVFKMFDEAGDKISNILKVPNSTPPSKTIDAEELVKWIEREKKELPKLLDHASGHGDSEGYARLCGMALFIERLEKKISSQTKTNKT